MNMYKYSVLLLLLLPFGMMAQKTDFGYETDGRDWVLINDDVMGGLSQATAHIAGNRIIFQGEISLANNGGFASLRSTWTERDLSEFSKVNIRYKSGERAFGFVLENNRLYYRPNYKYMLPPTSGEWQTLSMNLSEFKSYTMGRENGYTLSDETLRSILRYGVILYDKQSGPFQLEIDYIAFE